MFELVGSTKPGSGSLLRECAGPGVFPVRVIGLADVAAFGRITFAVGHLLVTLPAGHVVALPSVEGLALSTEGDDDIDSMPLVDA